MIERFGRRFGSACHPTFNWYYWILLWCHTIHYSLQQQQKQYRHTWLGVLVCWVEEEWIAKVSVFEYSFNTNSESNSDLTFYLILSRLIMDTAVNWKRWTEGFVAERMGVVVGWVKGEWIAEVSFFRIVSTQIQNQILISPFIWFCRD